MSERVERERRGWRVETGRWVRLMVGLFGCGAAASLMIDSRLGLGPWDAFHVGLHRLTGLSVGSVSIVVGLVIVCGSLLLKMRPGLGTLVNMVMIGVFIDLILPHLPQASHWSWGLAYYATAIVLFGLSTGIYIGAGLGSGPRDGLMIGLSQRSGWPVRRVRTVVEVFVLAAGWMMGGKIGVGTVLFTFSVGPAMQWGMQFAGVLPRPVRRGTPAVLGAAEQGRTAPREAA